MRAYLENVAKRQIPLTCQESIKALQIPPPRFPSMRGKPLDRQTEEDGGAEPPVHHSAHQCAVPAGRRSDSLAAPDVSAGSYDPPLLSLPDLDASAPARPPAAENAAGT